MKIGMTSLTLGNNSPAEVLKIAKEIGLDGIEWGVSDEHLPLRDEKRAKEIRELSGRLGVEIFSLGSYCRMEEKEDCDAAIETAVLLGAPVIRVWAGTKSPNECDEEYRKMVVENTVYMAEKAAVHGIVIGFEYHPYTLTETCDEALSLVKLVNKNNVGLYWQPDFALSMEENHRDRNRVLPVCVGNMHIQNYTPETGYGMLSEMKEKLVTYYDDIKVESYRLMIEFVKDGSVENLKEDAETLRSLLK